MEAQRELIESKQFQRLPAQSPVIHHVGANGKILNKSFVQFTPDILEVSEEPGKPKLNAFTPRGSTEGMNDS
jgi:hypothetical protein